MNPGDLADGLAMEAEFDAISQAFGKLPNPHTGGNGFDGPVRVGDAVNTDEAVNKGQLDNALGTAKLLPIATYGDLNAAAWAALPSGSYLLFGAGSQFSNAPWALTAGKTYSVAVRHVIGDAGVSLYLDEVVLSSTDDTAHVDIGRPAYRLGQTLAGAYGVGWNGMALKKGGLPPLEALTPAADRLPYYNGANGAALTPLTAFGRSLLDDMGAAEALATLGALSAAGGTSTGDQLGITAPQFANDKKFATTEFVQRALGNHQTAVELTATTTLTAAHCGRVVNVAGPTPFTVTLPLLSSVPDGGGFMFHSDTYAEVTVARQGSDPFVIAASSAPTSLVMEKGEFLFVYKAAGSWRVFGSSTLEFESQFGASLAASGYQKLPSGLIIQWGSVYNTNAGNSMGLNYPIAFPTVCQSFIITPWSTSEDVIYSHSGRGTAPTIYRVGTRTSYWAFDWMAIGY
jgi:hypothetical protein